jgi:hypothetical protein
MIAADIKKCTEHKQGRGSMNIEFFQELSRRYPPLLNQKQYCELTGKAKSTAEQDRLYGRGAPFIRMGRSLRYRLDDVVVWLDSLPRYNSTTAADNGNEGK